MNETPTTDDVLEEIPGADMDADKPGFQKGEPPTSTEATPEREMETATALEAAYHGMVLPNEEDVPVNAPGCQRCEVLPQPLRGPGTLHLKMPHTHTLGKVLGFLAKSDLKHSHRDGTLDIRAAAGSLAPILSPLAGLMSSTEQRDVRMVFIPEGQLPQATDYFESLSFPDFVAKERSAWLLDILRERRLRSVFQPIVRRAAGSAEGDANPGFEIYGYECLLRAQVDGEQVSPGLMFEMARAADLLFQLDLYARRAAITEAARHSIASKVFINFAPNSIYEPTSCLRSTVKMIDEVGLRREQVVFEIVESERLPEMPLLERIVGYYRDNGFGVALDDVGSGYSSLGVMLALKPDYVKVDRSLVSNVHEDPARAVVARKLLEAAQELQLKTIAEGIEKPEECEWVDHHGVDFMQGYYFARPGTPPPMLGGSALHMANGDGDPRMSLI